MNRQAPPDSGVSTSRGIRSPTVAALAIGGLVLTLFYAVALTSGSSYLSKPVWDEFYYQHIAEKGYYLPDGDYRQWSALPFSPGWPLLVRAAIAVTGLEVRVVSLLLSAVLFLLTCVGVRRVFEMCSEDPVRNNLALALFCVWPGSLYFSSTYAETLYGTLAAWFLVHLMRRRFAVAAWFAAAALFTRSPAIVLVGVLVVAVLADSLKQHRPGAALLHAAGRLALLLPVVALGLLSYMVIVGIAVGDPLGFHRSYVAWFPYFVDGFHNLLWEGLYPAFQLQELPMVTLLGCAFFVAVPLLVFPLRAAMPFELFAFVALGWGFFLVMDRHAAPFADTLRWTAILFPVWYVLALWLQRAARALRRRAMQPAAFVLTLGGLAALYVHALLRYFDHAWVS